MPWTRRPFGYRSENGEILVDENEAAEVRQAADAVLAGRTLQALVRDLNARGVTTAADKPWTVTALRRVLLNPRHAGKAVHRGVVVGDGRWQAILSPDVAERVREILTDPKRRTALTTEPKYLLSRLAVCGRCGAKMFASPMGQRDNYYMAYKCRATHLVRRLDLVDDVVNRVVIARLSRHDAADLLAPPDDDAQDRAAEATALRDRLDGLAALLADGTLTAGGVRAAAAPLRQRLDELERTSPAAQSRALAELVSADDVAERWAELPLAQRREVIELLMTVTILPSGKGVRFIPEHVAIEWRATP